MSKPINVEIRALNAPVSLNRWGVKVDGKGLEDIIIEAVGLKESDSYRDSLMTIEVRIVQHPSSVEVINRAEGEKDKDERIAHLEALVTQYEKELEI